ncbi:MAG: hypothetical protein R2821_07110 [Flavobacteriaceae bacterium]
MFELVIDPSFKHWSTHCLLSQSPEIFYGDCIPLLDENAIRFIQEKGGLKAIAISHPHYYSEYERLGRTI